MASFMSTWTVYWMKFIFEVWDSVVYKMTWGGVTKHGAKYMKITAFQLSSTFHDVKDNASFWAHNDINTSAMLPHFIFIKDRVGLKLILL